MTIVSFYVNREANASVFFGRRACDPTALQQPRALEHAVESLLELG